MAADLQQVAPDPHRPENFHRWSSKCERDLLNVQTCTQTSHLHVQDEAGEVVGRLPGVGHGGEVVEVRRPLVPVHHDDVHVLLLGQQVNDVADPDGGRAGRPVAVDDEGRGAREVEERLGGRAVVAELAATVQAGAGVEQQADGQAGSHEAVGQIQVGEVIARLVRPARFLSWSQNTQQNQPQLRDVTVLLKRCSPSGSSSGFWSLFFS